MQAHAAAASNVHWLIRLRWGALLGTVVLLMAAAVVLRLEVAIVPVAAILFAQAASNVALSQFNASESMLPWVMVLDIALFTALLWCTGGPSNPFNFLYLVYIALAAIILTTRWAWMLTALALLGYGVLFLVGDTTHHMHMMRAHLQGMWVAFLVAAFFIVYFVQRINLTLAAKESELEAIRNREERRNRLASLATLAAGAAHELSTPLSTIAVISNDLATIGPDAAREDARAIRVLVEQCHRILSHMAHQGGESRGESHVPVPIETLVADATAGIAPSDRLQIRLPPNVTVVAPRLALTQALGNVIKNAMQASTGVVTVDWQTDRLSSAFLVIDAGSGMNAATLAQVGEPFFTTKRNGDGTGLGVFLARAILEQLDGRLEIDSTLGKGTHVHLWIPNQLVQS